MNWTDATPAVAGLDPATRARLALLVPANVPAGAVLFRPGDAVRGYVIVLSGRIGVHLVGPNGRELLLYDVAPGQSCIQSTLGLLGEEDYSAEAVAETDASVVLLPKPMFLTLLDDAPNFRRLVFAAFAARMQRVMHTLEHVAFLKIEARLARHLLDRADGKGIVTATHADLARAIGSAREVVSRRLEAMARGGLIRIERGLVELTDSTGLKRAADDTAM
ncbi:MAG: Crp/Fnr family transcriptional regulator [Rhodobacteraceae bacterium]|nr:Crp/Fnr family transcriptional regulator [Paracoccaceae bacterium]